jgi:hypothetical protein
MAPASSESPSGPVLPWTKAQLLENRQFDVSIVPYPRHGYPLVPRILREILDVPISRPYFAKKLKFSDLDETIWDFCTLRRAEKLSKQVAEYLAVGLHCLPTHIRQRHLYNSQFEDIGDLVLDIRTYKHLTGAGLLRNVACLAKATIGQLVSIYGFGATCLLDLLVSLEVALRDKKGQKVERSQYQPTPLLDDAGLLAQRAVNVSIVPYPRRGYPLLPKTLREILNFPISKPHFARGLRLPDLDETVWDCFTRKQAKKLARLVIEHISQECLPCPPLELRHQVLYNPRFKEIQSLVLDIRTFNCLKRAGLLRNMACLASASIAQILGIRGFGAKCLLDLLCSLEHASTLPEGAKKTTDSIGEVSRTLDQELMSLARLECSDRNEKIVIFRFGLNGGRPMTLEAIAKKSHMTRERIRQICLRYSNRVKGEYAVRAKTEQVLQHISGIIPATATQLVQELEAEGLLTRQFELESILQVARLFSLQAPFEVVSHKRSGYVVSSSEDFSVIKHTARKLISKWGVVTFEETASQLETRSSKSVPRDRLKKVLELLEGFAWLDDQHKWFWVQFQARNRLVTRMDKVFSVTKTIHVSELRSAISRDYAFKGFAPPRRVLLTLCNQLPGYKVQDNYINCKMRLTLKSIFADAELAIVRALRRGKGLMSSQELEEVCLRGGMARSTFQRHLTYSPAIARYATNLYGLVGTDIPPGYIDSLQELYPRRKGRVLLDYGWHKGKIWLGYKLSRSMIHSGCFSVPTNMRRLVSGKFSVEPDGDRRVAELAVSDSGGWGLSKFFLRRGGEPGDYLVLIFDLDNRNATALMGNSNLFHDLGLVAAPDSRAGDCGSFVANTRA